MIATLIAFLISACLGVYAIGCYIFPSLPVRPMAIVLFFTTLIVLAVLLHLVAP
jgi:hypothetical protein